MKKTPFRLTPYQVQWLLIVGFVTVGYALYLRYLAIELSTVALACDAGLQTMLCKTRPEEMFRRKYGFDPLANNGPEHAREPIPPQYFSEHHVLLDDRFIARVNETIADSAHVPVLLFNGAAMRLRRLNRVP